jgi:hypothetical protein
MLLWMAASRAAMTSRLPSQKRVDEAQAIDGGAVLHVFGVKLTAAERQRRGR